MTEPIIRLLDVPRLRWLPRRRGGGRLSYATLWRWATRGVGGIKLHTLKVGGSLCTTEADLLAFFARHSDNADEITGGSRQSRRTPIQRRRDHELAERRLQTAGM